MTIFRSTKPNFILVFGKVRIRTRETSIKRVSENMDIGDPWREQSTENNPSASLQFQADSKLESVHSTVNSLKGEDPWSQLVRLIADTEERNPGKFNELLFQIQNINSTSKTGVPLLIYAIVYDHPLYIEMLHSTGSLDPNVPDTLTSYTPLMWCFHLNRQQCCIELLNFTEELDLNKKNSNGSTALDLVLPGTDIYEFVEEHKLFQLANESQIADLYKGPASNHNDIDHTLDNINLQTAGMSLEDENLFNDGSSVYNEDKLNFIRGMHKDGEREELPTFDFDHVLPGQFIVFADYDIPKLLDLLMMLPSRQPHRTTLPAAVIYQCIRYADHKKESKSLVESIFHLCLTKILSSSASTSGGVIEGASTGDIVLQSYWLSAINFLYYYLYREERFFKKYPSLLQELINAMHSIIVELSSSIHSRITPLIEPTILEYTTIAEVKQTLYKKDWNFFKKRKQRHDKHGQDSYDEILKMLYPPSLEEQMKPSPLKIVQIFGALVYVLELHQIHPLVSQQCLSTTVNWFSSTIFNKILSNKKKSLSRAHAIQIRLNLSVIQDWIKNHDFTVERPNMIDDFMWERFPYTLIHNVGEIDLSSNELRNIATYKKQNGSIFDMSNSLFYYQSFYHISLFHFEPLLQLLQWLQVATTLDDVASLEVTSSILNRLTPLQLLKSMEKYRYEVDESKFKSMLRKKLSVICKENGDTEQYLPERAVPLLALPTISELIESYTDCSDSFQFLPFLPIDIQDDIDEIHEQNNKERELKQQRSNWENPDGEESENETSSKSEEGSDKEDGDFGKVPFDSDAGDQLFKELHAPSTAAQRPVWAANDDIEANPW